MELRRRRRRYHGARQPEQPVSPGQGARQGVADPRYRQFGVARDPAGDPTSVRRLRLARDPDTTAGFHAAHQVGSRRALGAGCAGATRAGSYGDHLPSHFPNTIGLTVTRRTRYDSTGSHCCPPADTRHLGVAGHPAARTPGA